MNRTHSRIFAVLIVSVLIVVLSTDLFSIRSVLGLTGQDQDSPEVLLHRALEQANDAGSFQMSISLDQTVRQEHPLRFGTPEETAHFDIEGAVAKPDRARFSIIPGYTSFALAQTDAQEFLTANAKVYRRDGERWVETESDVPSIESDGLGLSLLSAARDVENLEPAEGPPALGELSPTFRRIGFKLYPDDVREYLLFQQGITDERGELLARVSAPVITGSGELWIDDAGFPTRLVLHLEWVERGQEPYRVLLSSTTDYGAFGWQFPKGYFNPLASVQTGEPLSLTLSQYWPRLAVGLFTILGGLGFAWLLARASDRRRRATVAVTLVLLAALLTPTFAPVAEAAGLGAQADASQTGRPPAEGSEVAQMIEETRELMVSHMGNAAGPAGSLDDQEDEDGDSLPNGYELRLGTSPFAPDSDYDGLTDDVEVTGYECEWVNHLNQPQTSYIKTDPLNPDSNNDGLPDGKEIWRGECASDNQLGYFWDDDNDDDGIPDGLDLSPFSVSTPFGSAYGSDKPLPNFVFETLDQDPGPETTLYPFYVELQVRPTNEESLRWAYKNLYWLNDHNGAIQSNGALGGFIAQIIGSSSGADGTVTLVPFLQAIVREDDLPSREARDHYGVSVSRLEDDEGNGVLDNMVPLYEMTIPLMAIERGGQVYAFQAKMLHDQNGNPNFTRQWHDVRLKWAVVADVLMANSEGQLVPSANGGYGLIVYEEPYVLTGLQVSRQGGASALIAAARPVSGEPYDDGPISLLRAGIEAQFLAGALSMEEIKTRFDTPNTATDEERWGIPQDQEYHVLYDPVTMTYPHLDAAIATTMMTTTRQVLDQDFGSRKDLEPTLVFASEQRTSTVNLDDDPPANYEDITINTCLKPMMTSRSLRLQTYRWDVQGLDGAWESLSLDEVLQKIEAEYAANTDPNYQFYFEELNILKMAATSWHIGQTAIFKIANALVYNLNDIMTDPEIGLKLLDQNGLLPKGFLEVVNVLMGVFEAGGPLGWLEQQWNKLVSTIDNIESGEFFGSFLDFSPSQSPSSGAGAGLPWNQQGQGSPDKNTLLGWTETAISILNMLATITGSSVFTEFANFLTKIIEIYKKLQTLINAVKAAIDILKSPNAIQAASTALINELGKLSQPLRMFGLVVAVGMIWAGLMMQLQLGDYGPAITATLVLKAIAETIITVALFVLAALFPWGTVLAAAIGLIKLVGDLFDVPLDPLSALIDWLFDVDTVEITGISGLPGFGELQVDPLEPGGGLVVAKPFRIQSDANITMMTYPGGDADDLNQSDVWMHLRKYNYRPGWGVDEWAESTGYSTYDVGGGSYRRHFYTKAGIDFEPWVPEINAELHLGVYLRVTIRYNECSTLDCDEHSFTSNSDLVYLDPLYFDIMPNTLDGLWHWEDLESRDPDADGLTGYINASGNLVGPDADLCPGSLHPSWEDWDTDDDGLSDKFEVENEGFDPCEADTDGDGVTDQRELFKGTLPDNADTDGDGLTDREEDVYANSAAVLVWPWTIDMEGRYTGLPDPAAYPNPRHANLDGDYRLDAREKLERSSPNAINLAPVGEPLDLWITQACAPNQGTAITIQSSPWANPDVAGGDVELELTLPVTFSNVTQQAGLKPTIPIFPTFNWGTLSFASATEYRWSLPSIFFPGRYVYASFSGVPAIPSEPVSITARLEYNEGHVTQVSTQTVPLRINVGGPDTTLVDVLGATILSKGTRQLSERQLSEARTSSFDRASAPQAGGSVLIAADAGDPDWVSHLYVCVKTSDTCAAGDWLPATSVAGTPFWLYDFTPPADGIYYVRAFAIDTCGTAGPSSDPWTLGVDQTPPADVRFDEDDAVYLTTSALDEARATAINDQPAITFTGQATDTAGAPYVSGVDWVGFLADMVPLGTTSVADPGELSSSFTYSWTLPESHYKSSMYGFTPAYDLLVGIADVAGNISTVSDTLRIVVDDTPPLVYANPSQTLDGTTLTLSGLADDTALLFSRGPTQPFASTYAAIEYDVAFDSAADMGSSMIVGDVNGDRIDDVVMLVSAVSGTVGGPDTAPFYAGLFLGRPEGLSGILNLNDADVVFTGELPLAVTYAPTTAAIGDINGDGLDDLLLGDPSTNSGAGRAYVVLGRRDWPAAMNLSDADWVLNVASSIGFGNAVGAAGDVNGDGLADFMVSAYSASGGRGPVWLYLGREQGAAPAHVFFFPPGVAGSEPARTTGLGDTNGDGLSDFLIAANGTPVALVYGRADDVWPASPVNLSNEADALFGGRGAQQTVSPAGDVNGDGLRDLLIGDPDATQPRVTILYGRRPEDAWTPAPIVLDLSSVADASFVDELTASSQLGASLAELGDVDGDGRSDFAFGQLGDGVMPPRVAIIFTEGRLLTPDMSVETATHFISDETPSYRFGDTLSAGDTNGDHVLDLLVGAGGQYRSELFYGGFEPGEVSGIAQVELGLFGPVVDPTQPFTATLPAAWQAATLTHPNERISAWRGDLAVPADGDYRVYARAQDQAGNMQETETWYLGNVWAHTNPMTITGAALTMNTPALLEQTNLTLSGTVSSALPIQHLRVYNGYAWQRLQPETGDWSWDSALPRYDERTLTFRAVARDAFGVTLHATRTLLIDARVGELPNLAGNLPPFVWHTDISPTLVITWPVVSDANGIIRTWATIDTSEQTSPVTFVSTNEVTRVLDAPGIYYGHARVQDGVGNEATSHTGPYLVNRTRTPSLILPDGELSFAAGEYPTSTLLTYDPYGEDKPTALWGTWDADSLYLGYPGYDWGTERLLALYLDTTTGGVTRTLAPMSNTHTLPFAADFAFVIGEGGTLYSAASGDWVAQSSPQSYAVGQLNTEIVLDRSEIQATGAVSMLAYIESDQGILGVLPPEARLGLKRIVGPATFVDNFYWPALGDGVLPNAGLGQVISPTVTVERNWDNVVNSSQTTSVTVRVANPSIRAYEAETLVVEADQEMVWTGVSGATCINCPADSGVWTVAVDVAAGTTHSVTFEAQVLGSTATGVVPISITASLPDSGLPLMEAMSSDRTRYDLDRGTAEVEFATFDSTMYAQPGTAKIPFFPGTEGIFERCQNHVEANVDGAGWTVVCAVGDCVAFETGIPGLSSQQVRLRVVGVNGCTSDPISQLVVADGVSPTAQIAPRIVYSGTLAFIRGTAWDEFPATRTPERVEVSINGGRFHSAFLSAVPAAHQYTAQTEAVSTTQWLFPLHLTSQDGTTVTLSARAVDEAGNVGPASEPVTVTLDNIGPQITITQTDSLLEGTINDGSGVASFEISLDGGMHYEPVAWSGGDWTFDMVTWSGSLPQSFAMLRATDVWGNVSHAVFPIAFELKRVYLPVVMRNSP
ncbi:MAG: FG-GAP repeat protein [Anaerolineae bacterium]|nr:FG-GAP repeat protein [Anaerolineae bacterium]